MASEPLPIRFTAVFSELYDALPASDVDAVDAMLDELEQHHGDPYMRNIVRVGTETLFATPRIYAAADVYRITWLYDDRNQPTAIACITVAAV